MVFVWGLCKPTKLPWCRCSFNHNNETYFFLKKCSKILDPKRFFFRGKRWQWPGLGYWIYSSKLRTFLLIQVFDYRCALVCILNKLRDPAGSFEGHSQMLLSSFWRRAGNKWWKVPLCDDWLQRRCWISCGRGWIFEIIPNCWNCERPCDVPILWRFYKQFRGC